MSIVSYPSAEEPHGSVLEVPLRKIEVEDLTVEVPSLLVDCFDYIQQKGLVEGIFRISGSVKRMRDVTGDYAAYKTWLDEGKPLPHDVSGITKKFTRDYLHSIGGLFPPPVLATLRELFSGDKHKSSVLGSESYRSASTSYSSGLESVSEESGDAPYTAPDNVGEKLDSLVTALVSRNLARKNALFIYYLSVLKCVSSHQDQTRMPNANLAIVFQQYLFETWVVTELQSYQALLEFLLDNYDAFVAKYLSTLSLLGPYDEFNPSTDNGSLVGLESMSTSPPTEYSSHQATPPKISISGSFDGRRRSSISQKLNSFWDSYSLPANRSKRFSFMSKSSGKSSSERLPIYDEVFSPRDELPVRPQQFKSSSCDDVLNAKKADASQLLEPEKRDMSRHSSICSQRLESIKINRHGSKRKRLSAFANGKSHMSATEVSASTPREPPAVALPLDSGITTEDLVVEKEEPLLPEQSSRRSISRRFSLWLRRSA